MIPHPISSTDTTLKCVGAVARQTADLSAEVQIDRGDDGIETIPLFATEDPTILQSAQAPREPHAFQAVLQLDAKDQSVRLAFEMSEPEGHDH